MRRNGAIRLETLPKGKADFIEPMDCAPVTKLLDGPGWVYEIKLDGYRAVAVKGGGGVLFIGLGSIWRLYHRHGSLQVNQTVLSPLVLGNALFAATSW